MSLRVAVVQGGPSSEAEVSRVSARGVAEALRGGGHGVTCLELDDALAEALRVGRYDVVFPVVHGAVGEDGSLQGLLEVMALPYVGSGVLASALAMNKAVAKRLFVAAGLPVARGFCASRGEAHDVVVARIFDELPAGFVVKPAESGSAIGIGRFPERPDREAAVAAVSHAFALSADIIVEEFVSGREVTCGVLEQGDTARSLPPTEVRAPGDAFYSYEARYALGRSVHVCPAELDGQRARVEEVALLAHRVLGCRDLSRADFVVGDARVVLLEVNTLPGLTPTSLFPEEAAAVGIGFERLCGELVERAHRRGATPRNAPKAFPV